MITIQYNLHHFFLTHLVSILLFTIIYHYLFSDAEKHYILNSNISKEEYLKHKWINSLYLSVNMQTTTGYVDFNVRSPLARLIALIQLFVSLLVTIGYIHLVK